MKIDLRKTLLAGSALVAVAAFTLPVAGPAYAQATEIDDTDVIAATDAAGLVESDADADPVGVTLDPGAAPIVFGADGTASLTASSASNLDITIGDDGGAGANTVTFAGDVISSGGGGIDITIGDSGVANGAELVIQGNVTETSGDITITIGDGGNADTNILTVDSANDENLTIAADIAGDVTDTSNLVVSDSDGAGNTVTFTGTVGDANLDSIVIGDGANNASVAFQGNVTSGGMTLGTNNGETIAASFGGSSDTTISGAVDTAAAGDTVNVTITGGNTVTTDAAWGATAAIDAVTIAASTTFELGANIDATTITLNSGSVLQTSAAATIGGSIEGGSGTFDVDADTTVEGSIGATTALSSIAVAEGSTLTVDANTFGAATEVDATTFVLEDVLSDANDAGLTIDTGAQTVDVNVAITTQIDGEGLITIDPTNGAGVVDFNESIGTSSIAVGGLTFTDDANVGTANIFGNLFVDTVTLNTDDELIFIGSGTQTASGTIDSGAGAGDIIVGNGVTTNTVNFQGDVGIGTAIDEITINDNATANFSGDVTTTTSFVVDGETTIAQNKTVTSAAFAAGAAAGTINLTIGNTAAGADDSSTLASGNALDLDLLDGTTANSATLNLVKGTGVISDGDEFVVGAGGATVLNMVDGTGETVADDFALFNFELFTGDSAGVTAGGDDDIVAVISAVSAASVVTGSNNADATNALLAVTAAEYAADADLASVYDNVTGANAAQIDERVEATQPTVDGGSFVGGLSVSNQTLGVVGTQLAALRADEGFTSTSGVATGNMSQGLRAWAQVFGATAEQDRRDGIDGYDADTFGLAVGLDTENIGEDTVLGIAFSYADTEVDSDNANRTNTEIDTYQITLYGDHDFDDRTYLSGMVGYAFGDNDQTRYDVGGVAGLNANSDFDSNQFVALAELGRDYMHDNVTITPNVMAHYVYFDGDDYTETGAGGAGLSVDQEDLNMFELGLGVDFSWMFQNSDGSYVKPELRVGYKYDVIGDEVEATSSFIGGGNAFSTEGADPAQSTFNAGAGIKYFTTDNWEFTANYDFEFKSDYTAHAGFLRAAYKF